MSSEDRIFPFQCTKPVKVTRQQTRGTIEVEDGIYFESDASSGKKEELSRGSDVYPLSILSSPLLTFLFFFRFVFTSLFLHSPTANITLADCLACSGCVTTAESILIKSQGVAEFRARAGSAKLVFVSVSPQVRASLSHHFGLSLLSTARKVTHFFKKHFNAHSVFDTSYSRYLSLLAMEREFMERWASSEAFAFDFYML